MTFFTPHDAQALIEAARSPEEGLLGVLGAYGYTMPPEVVEATAAAVRAWSVGEPYVFSFRDVVQHWRNPQHRRAIERDLIDRSLRSLLRDGLVFAVAPTITIHPIDWDYDNGLTSAAALTDAQAALLPDMAWIEVRLTVPIRSLPGWDAPAPAPAPEPALETR